jgi:hypothetical protein
LAEKAIIETKMSFSIIVSKPFLKRSTTNYPPEARFSAVSPQCCEEIQNRGDLNGELVGNPMRYPLVNIQKAIENGPVEIVDLPS